MRRFSGSVTRFVILEGRRLGVNRRGETLCLEVPQFRAIGASCQFLASDGHPKLDPRTLIAVR